MIGKNRKQHLAAMWLVSVLLVSVPISGCGLVQTRKTLKTECDVGQANSCLELGTMYKKGKGGEEDLRKAREYYEKACERDVYLGCVYAGRMWRHGDGGPADESEARYFFEKANGLSQPTPNGGDSKKKSVRE